MHILAHMSQLSMISSFQMTGWDLYGLLLFFSWVKYKVLFLFPLKLMYYIL